MGYAARNNPNSDWNKKRVTAQAVEPNKVITSQNTAVKVQTLARGQDEPIVIELTLSNIMGLFKTWLKSLKHRPSPALTN